MVEQRSPVDFDRLLKLRLVVARYGEMDGACWWNTRGLLGRKGALLMSRGFAKTHFFAQARVVFSVATARSKEVFNPPLSMTLWNLPADIEDKFEAHWSVWLAARDEWRPFFESIQTLPGNSLLDALASFGLVDQPATDAVGKMRRSAEGRAVPLSGSFSPNDDVLTLLAAGFDRGEKGQPAIPYARLDS